MKLDCSDEVLPLNCNLVQGLVTEVDWVGRLGAVAAHMTEPPMRVPTNGLDRLECSAVEV